jgi:ABC-type Fe3+-siderophore transport system permease subunit
VVRSSCRIRAAGVADRAGRLEETDAGFLHRRHLRNPINSEAVTNVAGRADLMAALGVLAALLQHARPMKASGWRKVLGPVGSFAATLFGVFSKENAAAAPAVMLLYDVVIRREQRFPLRRVVPAHTAATAAVIVMLMVPVSTATSFTSTVGSGFGSSANATSANAMAVVTYTYTPAGSAPF